MFLFHLKSFNILSTTIKQYIRYWYFTHCELYTSTIHRVKYKYMPTSYIQSLSNQSSLCFVQSFQEIGQSSNRFNYRSASLRCLNSRNDIQVWSQSEASSTTQITYSHNRSDMHNQQYQLYVHQPSNVSIAMSLYDFKINKERTITLSPVSSAESMNRNKSLVNADNSLC